MRFRIWADSLSYFCRPILQSDQSFSWGTDHGQREKDDTHWLAEPLVSRKLYLSSSASFQVSLSLLLIRRVAHPARQIVREERSCLASYRPCHRLLMFFDERLGNALVGTFSVA
jgi:hypothetical protein